MRDRSDLLTERTLAASADLDLLAPLEAARLRHAQDLHAVAAVGAVLPQVAAAVELVAARLRGGGRLFYAGAGTSGRLGVLDAAECPPTFRSDPELVQGLIAGGPTAMFRAQEGAEDDPHAAAADLTARGLRAADALVGIAAGGTTPYVHGALRHARAAGAATIFLTCVQPLPDEPPADLVIRPLTGPEVLTGSTRLKAGTATKLVLNMLSTLVMVQLGKVYGNQMVDLRATNAKLRDRAERIVRALTGVDDAWARALLEEADGHVKLAILMQRRGVSADTARQMLAAADGHLRRALEGG
jgi:N-acetylmuramic acid 6-phosphate etherase